MGDREGKELSDRAVEPAKWEEHLRNRAVAVAPFSVPHRMQLEIVEVPFEVPPGLLWSVQTGDWSAKVPPALATFARL